MHTEFWLESLKGRDHLKDLGSGEKIILKLILRKQSLGVWIGFIWLMIGSSGRLMWTQ
jgi:hypothetical protein